MGAGATLLLNLLSDRNVANQALSNLTRSIAELEYGTRRLHVIVLDTSLPHKVVDISVCLTAGTHLN